MLPDWMILSACERVENGQRLKTARCRDSKRVVLMFMQKRVERLTECGEPETNATGFKAAIGARFCVVFQRGFIELYHAGRKIILCRSF